MAFKQYKGDRMPSALPQKNLSGQQGEDKGKTLSEIAESRKVELDNKLNEMDPFTAAMFDQQGWYDDKMSASVDSLNAATNAKFEQNMADVKAGKLDAKEAAKWDRRNFTWGKEE